MIRLDVVLGAGPREPGQSPLLPRAVDKVEIAIRPPEDLRRLNASTRTSQQYLRALRGRAIFYRGRKESVIAHPTLKVTAQHAAKLFDIPNRTYADPELGDVSRYFKVPHRPEDLSARHKLIYDSTMFCNGIFNISQAIGSDAIFSLLIASREAGGDYLSRVAKYLERVAKEDLTIAVAQTDVKGDRSKRPGQQQDPDMYVRVAERRKDGIVVRGAKAHTTQSAVSDELIVLPTRAMTEGDQDYALAFAVPVDAKGVQLISRPIEEVEGNSSNVVSRTDYELETLTIFDNVFVPWDRVFLLGEQRLAGDLANLFATYHRFTAISYRAAMTNLFLGAARLVARANGVADAAHIREAIIDIVVYKESMKMAATSAATSPLDRGGVLVPNPLYVNIGKLFSNANFSNVVKDLIEVSGGIISTLPSMEDMKNPEERRLIMKFLSGSIPGEERVAILRLAKELASSSLTGYLLTLMVHAEGSVVASKLALLRDYDFTEAEALVKKLTSA